VTFRSRLVAAERKAAALPPIERQPMPSVSDRIDEWTEAYLRGEGWPPADFDCQGSLLSPEALEEVFARAAAREMGADS
jgi:hypothetical protein